MTVGIPARACQPQLDFVRPPALIDFSEVRWKAETLQPYRFDEFGIL